MERTIVQSPDVFPMSDEIKQTPTGSAEAELGKRVEERFGVLPNFFRLAPETPEITEKLWGFAQAAYLDNPLPSVFKERLSVHRSPISPLLLAGTAPEVNFAKCAREDLFRRLKRGTRYADKKDGKCSTSLM